MSSGVFSWIFDGASLECVCASWLPAVIPFCVFCVCFAGGKSERTEDKWTWRKTGMCSTRVCKVCRHIQFHLFCRIRTGTVLCGFFSWICPYTICIKVEMCIVSKDFMCFKNNNSFVVFLSYIIHQRMWYVTWCTGCSWHVKEGWGKKSQQEYHIDTQIAAGDQFSIQDCSRW